MLLREAMLVQVMYFIPLAYREQTVAQQGTSFPFPLCLLAIFLVSWLWLDLRSALINVLTITMILVSAVGFMVLCGIHYNPVTQSVLLAGLGRSVAFVLPMTASFGHSTKPTHVERAMEALNIVAGTMIYTTGLVIVMSIPVLALAKSPLIRIPSYLFLAITLSAFVHGSIFLPLMLSFFGPAVRAGVVRQVNRARASAGGGRKG